MQDKEIKRLIYDVYNKRWKTDGISGTITTNCGSPGCCGCMYIVVGVKEDAGK